MAEERLIWFNGQLVAPEEAQVPILSPTAQFGLNVFEGIRGYWSEAQQELYLFRLCEHLERLMDSCRLIGIESPHDAHTITAAIREVLQANAYRCDVAVRTTLFVGGDEGSWANSTPVGMFIAPIAKKCRDYGEKASKACVSTWERIDDRALPPRIKAGANYINGRYAHLEAQANGYDLPLLLDRHGKVSEGAGSCLMMVREGVLITPPITSSILESITRDTLLTLANEMGLQTQIRSIDRTELYLASELFLCGSAAQIRPLGKIDRYLVGDGTPGSVTQALLARYLAVAEGEDVAHRGWLTPVWEAA